MWQFYVSGVEQLNVAVGASVSNELNRQNSTFTVECNRVDSILHFEECKITQDGEAIAAGLITSQNFKESGIKRASITATDYYYVFQRRIVVERFENMRASDILKALISKYAYEFSTAAIDDTLTEIELFECEYILLSEAITQLMSYLSDWYYYIDADKVFHLFESYETDGVRFEKNAAGKYNFKKDTLSVTYDADNVVSRVWVIGAEQAASSAVTQLFTCDGQNRYFTLAYEPNYTEIYLDDELQESLLEENDDEAQDFLINKDNRVVFIPSYVETPYTGTLKVVYNPTVQVIEYFEDSNGDSPYLLEKVVKNKDITDKMTARAYGRAEIKRVRSITRSISFQTSEKAAIGQRCYVNISDYNIDGFYLVKRVQAKCMTEGKVINTVSLEEI